MWQSRSPKESSSDFANTSEESVDNSEIATPGTTEASGIFELDLSALRRVALNCKLCSLHSGRNNVVFGEGHDSADLMFIGEGPGADEDAQGLPFVGRAGQLLTSMIEAMGFARSEVYIANIVKCRPPNNRDPKPEEATSCAPYLLRQIELVSPKIIVALGRVSAQLLLQTDQPIGQLRGEVYKFRDTNIDLVVTYHPAYLVRKLTEKSKSWDDLWQAKQLLN